jgi:murein DD-endopeptidase MepM/ murein hydrolase activator NlpD
MIRLTPPTTPAFISSGWGADRSYRGGWHAGLDFPAKKGTPILAAAGGTVAYVKNVSNSYAGKYTILNHGRGIFTRYLHADSNIKKVGDRVSRGEKIGTVGTTGTKHSGAHVHFDVRMLPAILTLYKGRFGEPTTGFTGSIGSWGRAVPVEPMMDNATYKAGVLEASVRRGVKTYSMTDWSWTWKLGITGVAAWAALRLMKR